MKKGIFRNILRIIKAFVKKITPEEPNFFEIYKDMLGKELQTITLIKNITSNNLEKSQIDIESIEDECDRLCAKIKLIMKDTIVTPTQLDKYNVILLGRNIDDVENEMEAFVLLLHAGHGKVFELLNTKFAQYQKAIGYLEKAIMVANIVVERYFEGNLKGIEAKIKLVSKLKDRIKKIYYNFLTEDFCESDEDVRLLFIINLILYRIKTSSKRVQMVTRIIEEEMANA